jgi:hypothetical protein
VPDYINPAPPPTDPDEIAQDAFDRIRDNFPNFDPRESQLATIVILALALRIAEVADLGLVPRPVVAADFAALTMVTYPEVFRALALDNYAPGTNQTSKLDFGGTITGGTFTVGITAPGLSLQTTNPITWAAGDISATIQAAIEALPAIDPGEAVVTLQAGTPNDSLSRPSRPPSLRTPRCSLTSASPGSWRTGPPGAPLSRPRSMPSFRRSVSSASSST